MAVMFTVILYDCRRGRESLVDLKKDSYERAHNDALGRSYWRKIRGELTKNHRKDTEDVRNSGIIPFYKVN